MTFKPTPLSCYLSQLTKIMPFPQRKSFLFILSIAIFSTQALGTVADHPVKDNKQTKHLFTSMLLASDESISADQAAIIAKQGQDSKVLKISTKTIDNRDVYRVKLLTPNGHVRYILVDARSGDIVQGKK